jgi:uncharacterized membrane protein YgdD (TMEM256/DUF423 family)
MILSGAALWLFAGMTMTWRPAGHPPDSYRATSDMLPYLGMGLALVAVGLCHWLFSNPDSLASSRNRAILFLLAGALVYLSGTLIRKFNGPSNWEPMMPIGFLMVVTGFVFAVWSVFRGSDPGRITAWTLLLATISLAGYNDQYMPWMAVCFSILIMSFLFQTFLKQRS